MDEERAVRRRRRPAWRRAGWCVVVAALVAATACGGSGGGGGADAGPEAGRDAGDDGALPRGAVLVEVDFSARREVRSASGFLHGTNVFSRVAPAALPDIRAALRASPDRPVAEVLAPFVEDGRLQVDERALRVLRELAPATVKFGPETLLRNCLSLRYAGLSPVVHVELYDAWIEVDAEGRVFARNPLQSDATRAEWRALVEQAVEDAVEGRCGQVVYNVWGEPDAFWDPDGEPIVYDPDAPDAPPRRFPRADFLELFVQTQRLLAALHRDRGLAPPRMAGPNTAEYRADWLGQLADAVAEAGGTLPVVSFHELGRESEIVEVPGHVAEARELVASRGLPRPEVHVTEYANALLTFAPATALAYLAAMEAGGVEGAARACWSVEGQNFCYNASYNGLFAPRDLATPLPPYWTYRHYVDGVAARAEVRSGDRRIAALASAALASGEGAQVLLGYYGAEPASRADYERAHPPVDVVLRLSGLAALPGADGAAELEIVHERLRFDFRRGSMRIPEPAPAMEAVGSERRPLAEPLEVRLPAVALHELHRLLVRPR